MATYTELATFVSDWANRDINVLNYNTIRQCIRYAHDECYRTLRIAPMEITRSGTVTLENVSDGFLRIDDDLVEFIQLRKEAGTGTPTSYSPFDKKYVVAEAHADARSFQGDSVTLYSDYAFYREGTKIYIYPQITEGDVWELFYYRRLPEANERFTLDEALAAEGFISDDTTDPVTVKIADFNKYFELVDADEHAAIKLIDSTILDAMTLTELNLQIDYGDGGGEEYTATDTFIGKLKQQWLRDVNEKALLFGALYQAFDYLDENEQTGKYKSKFEQEIYKLNQEEMMRMNSGGNININFYNRLI